MSAGLLHHLARDRLDEALADLDAAARQRVEPARRRPGAAHDQHPAVADDGGADREDRSRGIAAAVRHGVSAAPRWWGAAAAEISTRRFSAGIGIGGVLRLGLAVADRDDGLVGQPEPFDQHALHRRGAALRQALIEFVAAAGIGVAGDDEPRALALGLAELGAQRRELRRCRAVERRRAERETHLDIDAAPAAPTLHPYFGSNCGHRVSCFARSDSMACSRVGCCTWGCVCACAKVAAVSAAATTAAPAIRCAEALPDEVNPLLVIAGLVPATPISVHGRAI